jgi:hypothetical protein
VSSPHVSGGDLFSLLVPKLLKLLSLKRGCVHKPPKKVSSPHASGGDLFSLLVPKTRSVSLLYLQLWNAKPPPKKRPKFKLQIFYHFKSLKIIYPNFSLRSLRPLRLNIFSSNSFPSVLPL